MAQIGVVANIRKASPMQISRMIQSVEVHAEGEPGRVITGGAGHIPGASVYEKMLWMQANADDIRLMMLREPRGHAALCCNLIVPPCDPCADAGFIIMEQAEQPTGMTSEWLAHHSFPPIWQDQREIFCAL